jgi:ABC-type nitrate/sulfonate/bicarbonate transport system permease component
MTEVSASNPRSPRPPRHGSRLAALRPRTSWARAIPVILIPAALIGVWQLYCSVADVNPQVLPTPSRILVELFRFRDLALDHTAETVKETAVGFSAAVAFAVVVAVIMDQLAWLRRSLYPLLLASQTIPIIAIAPLMVLWFGFGLLPKALVIVLVTFFPVLVSLLDGFASTEREAMNLLHTMGASRFQIFRYLRFPSALPFFFTGVRISASYAVVAAIFAEYVGAFQGLGIWMQISKNVFRTDLVFGAILITSVLSISLFTLVTLSARLTIPWYYAARRRTE